MNEKLRSIVASVAKVEEEKISPQMRLVDDLGLDSLDLVTVVIRIEQELGVQLEREKVEPLRTVGELNLLLED